MHRRNPDVSVGPCYISDVHSFRFYLIVLGLKGRVELVRLLTSFTYVIFPNVFPDVS